MSKDFVSNEKHIQAMFLRDGKFVLNNEKYRVLFADKPSCKSGEPKTDIFIRAISESSNNVFDLKISYKQKNADFIENKINSQRAAHILGAEWKSIIQQATTGLCHIFAEIPLIYCSSKGRTNAGAFTMGWKFELLNVKSGKLSQEIQLTQEQKIDIYAGNNLPAEKRDAFVKGERIKDSGVANYIFEESFDAATAQDVIDNMLSIEDYLVKRPHIYYACKALNYRSFQDKYDGDRPLSVFVDWGVSGKQLTAELRYDAPLMTTGNAVYAQLKAALSKLNIKTTDDIIEQNVANPNIIWK